MAKRTAEITQSMTDEQLVEMTSPMAAVLNLTEAAIIAIMHADRKQRQNWGEGSAIMGLPGSFTHQGAFENMAGSMKLFNLWCEKHNVDPEMHLKAHGITENNAKAYLELGAYAIEKFGKGKKVK